MIKCVAILKRLRTVLVSICKKKIQWDLFPAKYRYSLIWINTFFKAGYFLLCKPLFADLILCFVGNNWSNLDNRVSGKGLAHNFFLQHIFTVHYLYNTRHLTVFLKKINWYKIIKITWVISWRRNSKCSATNNEKVRWLYLTHGEGKGDRTYVNALAVVGF